MNKEKLKIGILDDDESKVTQIMCKLDEGFINAEPGKVNKYSKFELMPFELTVEENIEDVTKKIIELNLDCVLVDYKLSSYETVDYTGVEVVKHLLEVLFDFPVFILTSHEDDLFNKEIFNAYQVFDFARYIGEKNERIELNSKIIEQILKYRNQQDAWKKEIKKLIPVAGRSSEIDERIFELDSYLERSIDGHSRIPDKIKRELSNDKMSQLLFKLDELIDSEKRNNE
ncbi:MAG: hypothetical protein COA82_13190 [Alkaliphilus sp.]|nr:hypothetical protein [Alkaliphilus sp. AH-315-G20]PHS28924.1 MAG: hypothetical protein COA82_13190 [Alkaliphilus sp.]